MADLDVTKKLHLYHLLYRLNLSFAAIVRRCREFQQTRRFRSKDLIEYQGLAQELQADINQTLLETLHQDELDDWARFGKVSAAREKELRDPDDVFIHAEERKKQLAVNTQHSAGKKHSAVSNQQSAGRKHSAVSTQHSARPGSKPKSTPRPRSRSRLKTKTSAPPR